MPQSSAKKYRLKRKSLIDGLFDRSSRTRQSVASGDVLLVFDFVARENVPDAPEYRAAVTTTKRVKRAVDRNRAKRVLRAEVQKAHSMIVQAVPGNDLLIFMMIFRGDSKDLDCARDASSALSIMSERLGRLRSSSEPAN